MKVLSIDELPSGNFSRQLEGKNCGDPGVSLILVDAAPGEVVSPHVHPYAEVMIVQEGTIVLTQGSTTREVGPGTVVVIPANEVHGFTTTGDGRSRQVNLHVADAFVTYER